MRIKNLEKMAGEPAVVHAVAGAVYVVPTANPLRYTCTSDSLLDLRLKI